MANRTEKIQSADNVFQPVSLGPHRLANRIVMAPLTRSRAREDGVPNSLMVEYYAQRASAGLIITECLSRIVFNPLKSFVIQEWWPDSRRVACGRQRTADVTIAAH